MCTGDKRRNICFRASPSDAHSWCTCPVCPDSWRSWPRTAHMCYFRCLHRKKTQKNRTLPSSDFMEQRLSRLMNTNWFFVYRRTFVIAFRTLLKADRQISDSKVSRRAGETRVLTSARANLTGLVTRPANAALIRETPGRTATDACAGKKDAPRVVSQTILRWGESNEKKKSKNWWIHWETLFYCE